MDEKISYGRIIGRAIANKWPDPADREVWYARQTAVRRTKLHRLHEAQQGRCYYCHEPAWIKLPNKPAPAHRRQRGRATLDHKIPQQDGGTDNPANLVLTCSACNNARGTMDFAYFAEVRGSPEKWAQHVRDASQRQQERVKERHESRRSRREKLVWSIALLFYIHANYGS